MPVFSYSVADFVALTKIRSADVNSKFNELKAFLNTTKLDSVNIQTGGVSRAGNIAAGTAGALVVNAVTTGLLSEVVPGGVGKVLISEATGNPPVFSAAGTERQLFSSHGTTSDPAWIDLIDPSKLENYSLTTSVAANALTIALKGQDGNDPSATNSTSFVFRNATANTGTSSLVKVTAATSIVVPSGATLGLASAQNEYIYVYLVNDTTPQLAVSGTRMFDEGTLQLTTTITAGATNRFTLYSTTGVTKGIRFIGRIQSNQTTSGTYAAATTEVSLRPASRYQAPQVYSYLTTGNGHGSTLTKIRRFSTNFSTSGITYADSSTAGGSWTIISAGWYQMHYSDRADGGTASIGISVNTSSGTTTITSLAFGERIASIETPGAANFGLASQIYYLKPGDIVRAQTDGAPDSVLARVTFAIVKVSD